MMALDPRRSLLFPALLVTVAIVAACAGGGGATAAPAAPSAPSAAPASEAPASEAPASSAPAVGAVELKVADSELGQIITDGAGMTLYGFTPDEPGTPTCYDDCATAWPPLLADDASAVTVGAGLDASKLSTVDRTDGGKQLKYGTWTLYYFANDSAPGDTNGQGISDVWYVIAPSGDRIK